MAGPSDTDANYIHGAMRLAGEHHLTIIEVTERGAPAWVVYRRTATGRTRLGRRSDPAALYRWMKKLCAGEKVTA